MGRAVQKRTEPKCGICSATPEARASFDRFLARAGEDDETLGRITLDVLASKVAPLVLGHKVSVSAVKRHRGAHTVVVKDDVKAADEVEGVTLPSEVQAVVDAITTILEGGEVAATDALQVIPRLWLADVRDRLARGERVQVGVNDARAASAALMAAEKQRGEAALLGALTGGLSQVFSKALGDQSDADEIEGEAEEAVLELEGGSSES